MDLRDVLRVVLIVGRMKENSRLWHEVDNEEKSKLESENRRYARELNSIFPVELIYDDNGGTWHVGGVDGPELYKLY